MTDEQIILLGLLDEIDRYCQRLKLSYWLIDHQLLFSQQGEGIHGYAADIAMKWSDFIKLREYIGRGACPPRVIEGLDANPNMPGVYYRYVKADSLFFDFNYARAYKEYGVAVNIHIIRKAGKASKRLLDWSIALASSIEPSGRLFSINENGEMQAIKNMRSNCPDQLQRKNEKLCAATRLMSLFWPSAVISGDRLVRLPAGYWVGFKKCSFMGHRFRIPRNSAAYLSSRYGENWIESNPQIPKQNFYTLFSSKIPYSVFLRKTEICQLGSSFYEMRNRYCSKYDQYLQYDLLEKQGWDVLFATEQRVRLWKKYMPMKERIVNAWNNGSHDFAMTMLDDYRCVLSEYSRKGISICFDKDFWDMHLQWLEDNGEDEYVALLESQVREEDLLPIDDVFANAWLTNNEGRQCS